MNERANVIISNGLGWEHVSVSLKGRCFTSDGFEVAQASIKGD